jgi:DNA-binding IclR family transcriptional regulator
MNIGAQAQRMPLDEIEKRFLPHLLEAAGNLSLALR